MSIQLETPLRKCTFCGVEANKIEELNNFASHPESKYRRRNFCKKCRNEYETKRQQKPHVKKKMREYYNRPMIMKREKIRKLKYITFENKPLLLDTNPRTNICTICDRKYPEDLVKQTSIHHEKYDKKNPLAHTIEVCQSCHSRIHGLGVQIGVGRSAIA